MKEGCSKAQQQKRLLRIASFGVSIKTRIPGDVWFCKLDHRQDMSHLGRIVYLVIFLSNNLDGPKCPPFLTSSSNSQHPKAGKTSHAI